jgi:hypothetical protein
MPIPAEDIESFHKKSELYVLLCSIISRVEDKSEKTRDELLALIGDCRKYQTSAKELGVEDTDLTKRFDDIIGSAENLVKSMEKRDSELQQLETEHALELEGLDSQIGILEHRQKKLENQEKEIQQRGEEELRLLKIRQERLLRIIRVQKITAAMCVLIALFSWPSIFAKILIAVAVLLVLNLWL